MDTPPHRLPALLRRHKAIRPLSALALLGLVAWAAQCVGEDSQVPAGPNSVEGTTAGTPQPVVAASPASAEAVSGSAAEGAVPDGLTPQEWARLRQALADTPDAASELQRIGRWLSFQRQGQRFQDALHRRDHGPQTQALARRIDAEMDTHLALGELSGPEALALKAAVLGELEPDTRVREQALTQWRQAHVDRNLGTMDPRDAAYLAAQAELVNRPGTRTDQPENREALQAQLTRVRERVYGTPASAP